MLYTNGLKLKLLPTGHIFMHYKFMCKTTFFVLFVSVDTKNPKQTKYMETKYIYSTDIKY